MNIFDSIPNVNFLETDVEVIVNNIKKNFEKEIGRTLYPGDPLLILINTFAAILSQQASKLEYIAKQNLVKYSDNDFIENLGALVGVSRLQPSNALTTLKFKISEEQVFNIIIPRGTRVTTGNKVYFETKELVEIEKGETEVIVNAMCQESGTVGNGFEIGQINQIVDVFPYFESVENTTVSNSGSDIESLESYRERIFEAPNSFSVAGPMSAYKFWAKSTNALISDVSVYSPTPGVVELIPLLEGGELPSDEILQEVYSFCSEEERRPLTDKVEVKPPSVKEYEININYFISKNNVPSLGTNETSNKVNEIIKQYVLWQKTKLGRDINPSKLTEMLMQTGIKRVEIVQPTFTKLNYDEVAICSNFTINFGGIEDE